jgi:hypothetical protein
MTRTDRKILFTALAFFALIIQGKNAGDRHKAARVLKLASLVEAFCMEHVPSMLWVTTDETGSSAVDQLIEQHIKELRDREVTVLPADRTALINMHDRLQQRKTRRMRREFYALATEDTLGDLVLKLLDEEIEDEENAMLA